MLDVGAMIYVERKQLPPRAVNGWGGAYAVGTIVRFTRVQRSKDSSEHVVVKVAVYDPPPIPLSAVDPASELLVVDRSSSTLC